MRITRLATLELLFPDPNISRTRESRARAAADPAVFFPIGIFVIPIRRITQ